MAAPFQIIGTDHVVLRTADAAALERFHLDVLGFASKSVGATWRTFVATTR